MEVGAKSVPEINASLPPPPSSCFLSVSEERVESKTAHSMTKKRLSVKAWKGNVSSKLQNRMKALSWRGRYTNEEYYPAEVLGKSFRVLQTPCGEMKGLGTGSTVWDGGQVLMKFIEHRYKESGLQGKSVIDLGSGTGIVGLAAAVLGADRVVLTGYRTPPLLSFFKVSDFLLLLLLLYFLLLYFLLISISGSDQKQVLHIARENVASCAKEVGDKSIQKRVSVAEYDWGDKTSSSKLRAPFDIILVADCIVPKLYPMQPLVDALLEVSGSDSTILICYDHRVNHVLDPRVKFRELCEDAGFSFKVVPHSQHHPDYVLEECSMWELKLNSRNSNGSKRKGKQ
eukprot:jgi/Bigna1/86565/estExt_fgenesh1_pg.C_110229